METLTNMVMRGLNYTFLGDYLRHMIYSPENLKDSFDKEIKKINIQSELTESKIKKRKELLKELDNLIKNEYKNDTIDTVIVK